VCAIDDSEVDLGDLFDGFSDEDAMPPVDPVIVSKEVVEAVKANINEWLVGVTAKSTDVSDSAEASSDAAKNDASSAPEVAIKSENDNEGQVDELFCDICDISSEEAFAPLPSSLANIIASHTIASYHS
jgi:hypothetical protein